MNGEIFHLGTDCDDTVYRRMSDLIAGLPAAITVFDRGLFGHTGGSEIEVDCVVFVDPNGPLLSPAEILSALHVAERGDALAIHATSIEAAEVAWGDILAVGDGLH